MREILFRGKRVDNGEWVQGDLLQFHDRAIIHHYVNGIRCADECDINTVGQYTGLTDRGGTKIFEGDIIYGINWMNRTRIYQMLYEDSGFYCFSDNGNSFHPDHITNMQVVGNIHDEPEVMKGE